ncbi:unnamed protein product [Mesocestoides corti]|uniref:Enoyl-[acyl-carrier-protein] reductase, mitochondrial n=2 Tax=Mesocestoides corti TaxID=53468 RepID=A0A0R3U5W0_MESCO|nr:unnamed protein product [Mesocestoides corti]
MLAIKNALSAVKSRSLSRCISSCQIMFKEHGEPLDVLYEKTQDIGPLGPNDVLVNYRASPINPSDINTIQGTYPLKPKLPGVPGNEGAGYVLECGPGVSKLKPGDLVMPGEASLGTWRSAAVYNESQLIKLNPKLDIMQAAFLNINPSTAYLMLKNYVDLKPGDCVIQNGATSAVGIYVMQMCKLMGINTINIFRARETPEMTEATRQALLDFGGTLVVTEDELEAYEDIQRFGKIRIGFNCVGGKPTLALIKRLDYSGVLVTYGGMARQPIPTPIGPLIFKDLQLRGFWLSGRENQSGNKEARLAMLEEITDWILSGKIKIAPFESIPHTDWKSAVSKSIFKDDIPRNLPRKIVLSFPEIL